MFKINYSDFIKILLISLLFISLNLILVNRSFSVDKNNICTSEDNKKKDYNCCEHCFFDNDSNAIDVKIFNYSFLKINKKYAITLNDKINLIDPKSNSPPLIIFSKKV